MPLVFFQANNQRWDDVDGGNVRLTSAAALPGNSAPNSTDVALKCRWVSAELPAILRWKGEDVQVGGFTPTPPAVGLKGSGDRRNSISSRRPSTTSGPGIARSQDPMLAENFGGRAQACAPAPLYGSAPVIHRTGGMEPVGGEAASLLQPALAQ